MMVRNVAVLLLVSLILAGCGTERTKSPFKAGDLLGFAQWERVEAELATHGLAHDHSLSSDRSDREVPTYRVERVRGKWLLLQGGIVSQDSGFLGWKGLRGWIKFKSILPGNPWVLNRQ